MRVADIKTGLGRVPGVKIAAPQRPPAAPSRPANWAALSPAERRAINLVERDQQQAADRAARPPIEKPANWDRASAIEKRGWLIEVQAMKGKEGTR